MSHDNPAPQRTNLSPAQHPPTAAPSQGEKGLLGVANTTAKAHAAEEKKNGKPRPDQVQAQYEITKDNFAAAQQQAHDNAPHATDGFVALTRAAATAVGAIPGIGAVPSAIVNGVAGVVDSVGSLAHGDSLRRKAQVAGNAAASIPVNATPIGLANIGLNSAKGFAAGKVTSDYATERSECKYMPELAMKAGVDCQKYITAAQVVETGYLVIPDPAMPTPVVAKQILIAHGIRPNEGNGR